MENLKRTILFLFALTCIGSSSALAGQERFLTHSGSVITANPGETVKATFTLMDDQNHAVALGQSRDMSAVLVDKSGKVLQQKALHFESDWASSWVSFTIDIPGIYTIS